MGNLRLHSCNSNMLCRYNVSTTNMNVYLLQRSLQCLPLASRVELQMAVINVIPWIVWKVCVDRVLILQKKIQGNFQSSQASVAM